MSDDHLAQQRERQLDLEIAELRQRAFAAPTPASILRAAAVRVRETAAEATPGPWDYDGNPSCAVTADEGVSLVAAAYNHGSPTDAANANHVSIWHPGVALAVADWLDAEAAVVELIMSDFDGVWRHPAEETTDYPGLWVHDGRVTGSITIGKSRLPLWAIISEAIHHGWDAVESNYEPGQHYGFTADDLSHFLYCLLEARGEFGRLLCAIANAERIDSERRQDVNEDQPWWEVADESQPVADALRRCLATLAAHPHATPEPTP